MQNKHWPQLEAVFRLRKTEKPIGMRNQSTMPRRSMKSGRSLTEVLQVKSLPKRSIVCYAAAKAGELLRLLKMHSAKGSVAMAELLLVILVFWLILVWVPSKIGEAIARKVDAGRHSAKDK